jgi:peroxiredoxin family protein
VSGSLSLVLFSGTDDKLMAAATLAAGAAAMDHGLAYDAARPRPNEPVENVGALPWLETFRQAKEIGEMTIRACSGSLDTLGLDPTELDPIVDSAGGIASFLLASEGSQILFI